MKNKLKTKKSISKRIKTSKKGSIERKCAYTSHLALNKTTKQKKRLSKGSTTNKSDIKRWKNLY